MTSDAKHSDKQAHDQIDVVWNFGWAISTQPLPRSMHYSKPHCRGFLNLSFACLKSRTGGGSPAICCVQHFVHFLPFHWGFSHEDDCSNATVMGDGPPRNLDKMWLLLISLQLECAMHSTCMSDGFQCTLIQFKFKPFESFVCTVNVCMVLHVCAY